VKEYTTVHHLERAVRGSPVYMELLARIQRGDVGPGDRLVDTALATELGVSRMPVREALLRLVHEGYLVGTTRGFLLPELSDKDIADIFEIRKLLEPRAAAAAAHNLDAHALVELEAAYRLACEAVEMDDPLILMQANTQFRQAWLNAVPNPRLAATIERFVDHVQTVRVGTLYDRETQTVVVALLSDLIDAFRSRNPLAVFDSMARFVDGAQGRFFALVAKVRAENDHKNTA
jgi:DNA-binding GntR family transcriptional regulator